MPYFTQEENILAAAYMRLSREDSKLGESNSITNQRMMLTDYITSHGMDYDTWEKDIVVRFYQCI